MDDGFEACVGFVVACCDPTEFFDLGEIVFDQMAPSVHVDIVRYGLFAIGLRRDDGHRSSFIELGADGVGVEGFVGDQGVDDGAVEERVDADAVVTLAGQKHEFGEVAERVDHFGILEFLSLFFLVRLLRHGRLRDAVWAGVSLGLGLSVYSAFRLFVLAVGLFAGTAPFLLARRTWRDRLKEKVDGGEVLDEFDLEFMQRVFDSAQDMNPIVDRNPDYKHIRDKAIGLCEDILEKSEANESGK